MPMRFTPQSTRSDEKWFGVGDQGFKRESKDAWVQAQAELRLERNEHLAFFGSPSPSRFFGMTFL
jgi:hypothetical protein